MFALHRSDCHSSQGSTVTRAAYRSTEQIKDGKNKLLFKMEICMGLSNAQDGEILIKIVNIHKLVLTAPTERLSVS